MGFFDDITDENIVMGASFKEREVRMRRYDKNVDYTFFEAHDVAVEEGKDPWVFFLRHPDLHGRFVWYPTTGTLMCEPPRREAYKVGQWQNSEDVYNVIMGHINTQED